MVEGSHFPFFGVAFSLEKIQFNQDMYIDIDQSKTAIKLAQRIANLFVDEARLNTNLFRSPRDEYKAVILNYDSVVIEEQEREEGALVSGELYLF